MCFTIYRSPNQFPSHTHHHTRCSAFGGGSMVPMTRRVRMLRIMSTKSIRVLVVLVAALYSASTTAPIEARVGTSGSTGSSSSYPLVERPVLASPKNHPHHRQTQSGTTTIKVTLAQLESLQLLSWSEDSAPKALTPVYSFGVYETKGDLPRSSLTTLSTGLGTWLQEELNTAYQAADDNNREKTLTVVEQVQVLVVTQSASATSSRRRSRSLQDDESSSSSNPTSPRTGSQLDTRVHVQFRHDPSPLVSDVETLVAQILMKSDLTTALVPSIQRLASEKDDIELQSVNEIYYLGLSNGNTDEAGGGGFVDAPPPPPTQEQATNGGDGVGVGTVVPVAAVTKDNPVSNDARSGNDTIPWRYIVPVLIALCLAMIVVALLVKQRRQPRQLQQHVTGGGSSMEDDLAMVSSSPATLTSNVVKSSHHSDVSLIWDEIAMDEDYHVETALMEPISNTSRRSARRSDDHHHQHAQFADDDEENDARSPRTITTTTLNNNAADDQSDIFSGIGAAAGATAAVGIVRAVGTNGSYPPTTTTNTTLSSPRDGAGYSSESPRNGDSRSVFSFLSGLASKASTVVASNVSTAATTPTPKRGGLWIGTPSTAAAATTSTTVDGVSNLEVKSPLNGALGGTPHSRVSSLFTFSEEDSDDLVSTSGDERTSPKVTTTAATIRRRAVAEKATSQSLLDSITNNPAATTTKIIGTVPSDEEIEGEEDMRTLKTAPSDEQRTNDVAAAKTPVPTADSTKGMAPSSDSNMVTGTKNTKDARNPTTTAKSSKGGIGMGVGAVAAAATAAVMPWIKRRALSAKADNVRQPSTDATVNIMEENTTLEDECVKTVEEKELQEQPPSPVDGETDNVNVSHVFDNDAGTDTSNSALDSPNTSLNDSMFAAAANAVPTLTIEDTSLDANHSWCKDSCAFNETEPPHTTTKDTPFVYTGDEDATASPKAKLSADEIAQELKEAEAESKKLKKMSTNYTMGQFGPTLVESPAAASYSNTKRSVSLPSPASSRHSHFSDPGPLVNSVQVPSPTTLIELQWDDPAQVLSNKAVAAAFVNSVAGQTKSTTTSNSSVDRFSMLTKDAKNRRMSTKSAGNADGTDIYQNHTAEEDSIGSSSKGSLSFRRGRGKPISKAAAGQLTDGGVVGKAALLESLSIDSPTGLDRVRRHAKNTAGDGTTNYQHETMADWSVDGEDRDDPSVTDSNNNKSKKKALKLNLQHLAAVTTPTALKKPPKSPAALKSPRDATSYTPRSGVTTSSSISGLSVNSPVNNSEASPSTELISDLLWLEQKIAATNISASGGATPKSQSNVSATRVPSPSDSLSFASGDQAGDSSRERSSETRPDDAAATFHQSIVCKDCYAPPGKLKIIIHSTKDGPAVHTVKKGSSLEGHIFAGDLIISVDNVDTRSYSAEQVMKMMTARTRFERKITVLHFDATDGSGADTSFK